MMLTSTAVCLNVVNAINVNEVQELGKVNKGGKHERWSVLSCWTREVRGSQILQSCYITNMRKNCLLNANRALFVYKIYSDTGCDVMTLCIL